MANSGTLQNGTAFQHGNVFFLPVLVVPGDLETLDSQMFAVIS